MYFILHDCVFNECMESKNELCQLELGDICTGIIIAPR